ncbi:TonB-dependent receptor [Horticoccus sp. 23ND18S-11]|uniref:TonB-dependent receptor n=1 Tax=Horticoccus sp. 23ND18S-11 TaxID=3391832 RepID=UPI0039C99045
MVTFFRLPAFVHRSARVCAVLVTLTVGVGASDTARRRYDLPAGDAAVTLRQLAEVSRREILFAADVVRGVQTNAVQGEFTALDAGNRMLAGTRLVAVQDEPSGALAVRRRNLPTAPSARPTVSATPAVVAATGTALLHGRVSNQATGVALEGAFVQIVGSDRSVATERDGTFTLGNLPVGVTTLRITYPGLEPSTQAVELGAGATSREFKLTSDIYAMDPFAVAAVREGNAAAIARQEQALTVGNSVSLDAYGNIAKGDLGSFLQRLPGVVGEYGGSAVDAILVRGLSPEFTSVMMDGTRTPSANPDSRSQLVSGLPSGAIESVEVIKTPTADMDADSLGGVVNLRTRSGFDRTGRTVVLNVAGGYNETMGRHLDPSRGAKTIFPQVSAEFSDVFEVFGRNLGVVVTGTYQEVGDGLQTTRAEFAGNWDYAGPTVARRFVYADQEFHLNKRADLHTKFDYRFSRTSSISLAAGFTRFRNVMEQVRPQYSDNVVLDPERSTADLWVFSRVRYRSSRDFRYTPSDTWRFQLNGTHDLGLVKLAWDVSYSDSRRPLDRLAATARSNHDFGLVYDRRASREFPTLSYGDGVPPPNDRFDDLLSVALTRSHEDATDTIRGAKLDATRDFPNWFRPVRIKAGFRIRQQERTRDYDELSGTMGPGDYGRYRDFNFTHGWVDGRYPATPIVDTKAAFRDAAISYVPSGLAARPAVRFAYDATVLPVNLDAAATSSLLNDYRTRETIPAAYLQSEVRWTRALHMTAGARVEQTRTAITSRLENVQATTPEERFARFKTVSADYTDVFPNLQFRFVPIRHLTFRANLSTTIGRPRMADLVGRFSVNDVGQAVNFSNPSLKPQEARNYDVSVEYYFEPVGVISVGGFRKDITRYVTATSFRIVGNEFGLDLGPYAGWTGSTRVNAGDGRVEGLEFNYAQQLSFLPARWGGLGVMANGTVLTSSGDYNGLVSRLPFKNYLVGLRPQSGNAGLTYNQGRWDVRLMWNVAGTYLLSLDTSDPSNSEFVGRREQWDFFARFRVTRNVSVFLDVINLAEDNRGRYRGLYRDDRRAQTNVFPRSISAGLQARF